MNFLAGFSGAVLLGVVSAAHADEAPARIDAAHAAVAAAPAKKAPEYVPIVVDRAQYEMVMGHLNGMAFKDALPLVRWLNELEERAKRQWEADNSAKSEEKAK